MRKNIDFGRTKSKQQASCWRSYKNVRTAILATMGISTILLLCTRDAAMLDYDALVMGGALDGATNAPPPLGLLASSSSSSSTFDDEPETAKGEKKQNRRRQFLNYTSSPWEQSWIERQSQNKKNVYLCEAMGQDSDLVRRFLNATCTSHALGDDSSSRPHDQRGWCVIDDTYKPLYFNTLTGAVSEDKPAIQGIEFGPPQPVTVTDENADLFSRLFYKDALTGTVHAEYIEPLVGNMRHPLTCCDWAYKYGAKVRGHDSQKRCKGDHMLITFRGHFLPPGQGSAGSSSHYNKQHDKHYYFDGGASDWLKGAGGPSLGYFHELWKRHGMEFDGIWAYEGQTTKEDFYASVPEQHRNMVHYQQIFIRSSPVVGEGPFGSGPFLPDEIQKVASKDDYVLFKLDIDSPGVEEGTLAHLVAPDNDSLEYIDEFFYEFHLMTQSNKEKLKRDQNVTLMYESLADWYGFFLFLRRAGVRAHAWI